MVPDRGGGQVAWGLGGANPPRACVAGWRNPSERRGCGPGVGPRLWAGHVLLPAGENRQAILVVSKGVLSFLFRVFLSFAGKT